MNGKIDANPSALCGKKRENNMKNEITDYDLEVIAESIKQGNTNGQFGSDDKRVAWDITINKF